MVTILLRYVAYAIERYKFPVALLFYSVVFTILQFPIAWLAETRDSTAFHKLQTVIMPYAEAEPHGKPIEAVVVSALTTPPPPQSTTTVWPLGGIVTTEFGASDYPYQGRHTGIDISSARPSGVLPVRAFRGGTITAVIRSSVSLGNHVTIDHGNGLTSTYAHLYTISVSQGQIVAAGDPVGTEGSTGASTGTHLHFEIRQGGVAQNPRNYINGNP